MKKALTLLALAGCFGASAQDLHFSHFYENAMLRNPGLTGIFTGDYKAVVNYRTQWGSVAAPFQTVLGSVEARSVLNKENGDAISYGLTVTYDKAGSINFNTLQVYPALAINKSLEDQHGTFLSVGFAGGYVQRSVDMSKATFDRQYIGGVGFDPGNATGESLVFKTTRNWDLSAGISLNSSAGSDNQVTYYLGVAAYHVARPKASFDQNDYYTRMNMRWSGNLGLQARLSPNFSATIHANYNNQWPHQETIVGGMLGWRNFDGFAGKSNFGIQAGAFYRFNDAIIPTVRLDFNTSSLIFSYDVNNSSLAQSVGGAGGYEMTLVVRGDKKRGLNPMDQMNCPRFEPPAPGYQDY